MGFREEFYSYFDADGLMGNIPNPGKWTGGNELLDTSIGMMLLFHNGYLERSDVDKFHWAVDKCRKNADGTQLPPGLYNKNPGRPDELTHDDLKGVAVASLVIGEDKLALDIYEYGSNNEWEFSNTGLPYYTAVSKPWNIAFYSLCAGKIPNLWHMATFFLKAAISPLFGLEDTSGIRQNWLHYQALDSFKGKFKEPITYLLYVGSLMAMWVWRWRIHKKWNGMRGVMKAYHGEKHPFVRSGLVYY